MSATNASNIIGYFPGLVDVCEGEDTMLVFLCVKDGTLAVDETATVDRVTYEPPPRNKLPFTVPRLSEVLRYSEHEDTELYNDVLAYLKRYSALDELQWYVVAHFVFLSYLHDHHNINYCPYLLFYAVPERGKSRTGKSVSYIAFRGIHVVEMREAVIFRFSNDYHGTLFFDIMDVSKKAEQGGCSDLLLSRAEKGSTSVRVLNADKGPFNDMSFFKNYGPTIIASNEQVHKILNTRCLPIDMPNIPGDYESPEPILGLELKERLTAWRARHMSRDLLPIAPIGGISGRLWDISKPMLQINALVYPTGREMLVKAILEISDKRTESKQDTTEGRLVGAIKELSEEGGFDDYVKWSLKTYEISKRYYEHRPEDKRFPASWFAKKLISMSIRHRTVRGLSEMLFSSEEYERLLEQYGYSGRGTTPDSAPPTLPLPGISPIIQDVSQVVGGGRGKTDFPEISGVFRSMDESEVYSRNLLILINEEGMARKDAEKEAMESVFRWRKDHDNL